MTSYQQHNQKDETHVKTRTEVGTGPEYDYPTTQKHEPVPVVNPSTQEDAELTTEDPAKAPAEDAPPLWDVEISCEEELENTEAGEWSEDMAENEPRPGEVIQIWSFNPPTVVE